MRRRFAMLCALAAGCAAPRATPIAHRPTTQIAPGPAWTPPTPPRRELPEIDPGRGLSQALALPRGKVVVTSSCGFTILEPVHFHPESAQLTPERLATVDEIAKLIVRLQSDQIVAFEIVGHADFAERDPHGVALARARTVAAALYARGVRDIEGVRSGGATGPRTTDAFERARNRRVDFLIVRRADK